MSPRFLVASILVFLALELVSIVVVAAWFGAFTTLFAIAGGMLLGVMMIRRVGFRVARHALAAGGVLDLSRMQGSGRVIGAALFFALPGFVSDLIAIGLLLAPRRPVREAPVRRPGPGDVVDLGADEYSRSPETPPPGVSRRE